MLNNVADIRFTEVCPNIRAGVKDVTSVGLESQIAARHRNTVVMNLRERINARYIETHKDNSPACTFTLNLIQLPI